MERLANSGKWQMADGKKKALVFFSEKPIEAQKRGIKLSSMDRAGACQNVVGEQVPKVIVVYGLLNSRAAADEVRGHVKTEEEAII
ncbi:MAG: hypothetical protein L7V86_19420 [Verrucomicrobiales bacterium]|nr:hypothetical protein [Verrucomicrobiales bacterium]